MDEFLNVAETAARAGGKILLDYQGRVSPQEKNPRDLVTEADLASQEAIQQTLLQAFPDHGFLGEEETTTDNAPDAEYRWIVDPLDGTTNYVHQMPAYSVSIALEHNGTITHGVVLDPIADEFFSAAAGQGAYLNGNRIEVSGCTTLNEALVACSFSANVPRGSSEVARFVEVLHRCQALRRLGSAALNLCYVGAGRLDAYWASSVKIWDIAAGSLIVQEAGGVMTHLDGSPLNLEDPQFAATASPPLHSELAAVLAQVS